MNDSAPPAILSCSFRAGSAYDLVVFDRLPPEEQALLAELRHDPTFYGVLRPRPGSGLTLKAVDRETALLWLTLREPGPLPFFVREGRDDESVAALESLVLDGVLELEHAGSFVAGAGAVQAVAASEADADATPAAARGRLTQLSILALRHGEAAEIDDPQRLSALLYGFNRAPLSPDWAVRLPDAEAVLAFVGAASGSPLARRLQAGWEFAPREDFPDWIVFTRRAAPPAPRSAATYKLYVSPLIEHVPQAFAAVVATLEGRPDGHFKIGSHAAGLLRPDKMVLYFGGREELLAAARQLEGALALLAGVAAQGVPFSAPIDAAGLLSWGMDPPATERRLAWQQPESWRLWLARRLAVALVAARGHAAPDLPAWRFALERVRREGVDVDRWTPSAALWAAA
jgi:hypothetical protein